MDQTPLPEQSVRPCIAIATGRLFVLNRSSGNILSYLTEWKLRTRLPQLQSKWENWASRGDCIYIIGANINMCYSVKNNQVSFLQSPLALSQPSHVDGFVVEWQGKILYGVNLSGNSVLEYNTATNEWCHSNILLPKYGAIQNAFTLPKP
jgi:hypothetical protein